ncbi:class I SAM-dependent methyltransferase [Candidatus Chloroploca asiatica]|uniref:class I SAM-dependent methyltransferase n=1 Tax=Candidatus Chloroploca asiatica TaxID=1506545 RepID=UPI000BE7E852|nr:class I SAM-dependent methyltransferase [Candidatus Chloroploca asiatica]
MRNNRSIYDSLYREAQTKGWQGWGGDARLAEGPNQLRRIMECRYTPRAGRALELGCGEGHLCRLLASQGFEVTGVDISEVAIDWAKAKQGEIQVRYVQADLCSPEVLPAQRFELIVDGNCLHCVVGESRSALLKNVRRLLAHGGVFFVSSLCTKASTASLNTFLSGHPYRFVPAAADLLAELREEGFTVLSHEVEERSGEFDHIRVFTSAA